jgi:hypothetical protein
MMRYLSNHPLVEEQYIHFAILCRVPIAMNISSWHAGRAS